MLINGSPNNEIAVSTNNNVATSETEKHWLVNLSDTDIPDRVQEIIKLGEKFCPPVPNISVPYVQIIADIEGALLDSPDDQMDKPLLRNQLVNILTNFKNHNRHHQRLNQTGIDLLRNISYTKKFLKDHEEILLTKADKGNISVIVNRSDYVEKLETMLADTKVYKQLKGNNTISIQTRLNRMVTTWQNEGRITESVGKSLRCHHGVIARLYGLPKIHKQNTPYRPIVSSIGTPLYDLSAFLSKILNSTVGKSHSTVKNSLDFKEKIQHIVLPDDHIILSLDVVSLFTNIDSRLALALISDRWREIKRNSNTKLKKIQFIEALELVLSNCEFVFNGNTYKQLFGSPMGSPVSPAVAELVMEHIEANVLRSLDFSPIFYFRYVDDIVTAIPKDKLEILVQAFNAFNNDIKFTVELESGNKLPFLDLLVVRNVDGSILTDWFHKPTWSGRYLNFNSHLPNSYKRNTVTLLANKILQLSHPSFHKSNFSLLKSTLLNNNYPYSFFNPIIKSTIYKYHNRLNERQSVVLNQDTSNVNLKTIAIPYIKDLHEQLSHCLKRFNFRLVGRAHNSLNNTIFSSLKDSTRIGDNKNVVYMIECECKEVYIGQTQQLLSSRVYQHKRDAKKLSLKKVNPDTTSALSAHLHRSNHDIYLDKVKILNKESNVSTRRVLEMIHIKRNPNCLNKQSDSVHLHTTYNHLLQSS